VSQKAFGDDAPQWVPPGVSLKSQPGDRIKVLDNQICTSNFQAEKVRFIKNKLINYIPSWLVLRKQFLNGGNVYWNYSLKEV
jgi:hypothetical protein